MSTPDDGAAAFSGLVDLAAARVGGQVLAVTDEWFAPAKNLLEPGRGVFIPGKYISTGKWMDGWESRRKRELGYDWCVIRLGLPGVIHGVDVDTNHFLGNHPAMASVEACEAPAKADKKALAKAKWETIVPQGALRRGSQNLFAVKSPRRFTHVRLNIFPDGGVARLRVFGEVRPDPAVLKGAKVDLAGLASGGTIAAVNDQFFGPPQNMLLPGPGKDMGDGWETRRKRDRSEDWCVVKLGARGSIGTVQVDTHYFKGNFPESVALDGLDSPDGDPRFFAGEDPEWTPLMEHQKLGPDKRHRFTGKKLVNPGPFTHVRVRMLPDGGISRLRLLGKVVP